MYKECLIEFKNNAREFYNILLDTDFGKIPSIEGYHKFELLKNKKILMVKSLDAGSKILVRLNSEKIVLGIKTKSEQPLTLTITSDSASSNIYMKNCNKNYPCLLKVSNVPLFYSNNLITSIMTSENSEVTFYEPSGFTLDLFW